MEKEAIENELLTTINTNQEITKDTISKAQNIQFRNIPNTFIQTDDFGFLTNPSTSSLLVSKNNHKQLSPLEEEQSALKSNSRIIKWLDMLNKYNKYKTSSKLKSRTRKGIPDDIRGQMWQLFANIDTLKQSNASLFADYVNKIFITKEIEINSEDESVIIRDLHRTFPTHYIFRNKLGEGQRALFRVLSVYAVYNTNTGYVQGMGFITALFLTYMDEESAFWMLHSLMKNYELEGFFKKGFPELRKCLYVMLRLLKRFIPNVYERLKEKKVYPTMYAAQWFFTFYSCVFDFEILVRIFDCLLLEGFKVIYRIALGIFKCNESNILKYNSFEELMSYFKQLTKDIDVEMLLQKGFSFSFSRRDILRYQREYETIKSNKNDEIIKQVDF